MYCVRLGSSARRGSASLGKVVSAQIYGNRPIDVVVFNEVFFQGSVAQSISMLSRVDVGKHEQFVPSLL